MSVQKRKVRIYIIMRLSKGKNLVILCHFLSIPVFGKKKNQRVSPRYKEAKKINEKLNTVHFQIRKIDDLDRIRYNK